MKKQLLLLLFFISSCLCGCFKNIVRLSKQITRNQKLCSAHVYEKQKKLLVELRKMQISDDIPNNVLQAIVDGLHKGNNFPQLVKNIKTIDKAMNDFTYKKRVPQFCRTLLIALRNIGNKNYAKGILWEIKCAVNIEKETNQTIISFETPLTSSDGLFSRRFDLVTNENGLNCACECKNIKWHLLASNGKKKLTKQLLDQKHIIDTKNETIYRLYSKNPIPKKWKKWLHKNNIEFVDMH